MKLISIIILNYKQLKTLKILLETLNNINDIEIIIINDDYVPLCIDGNYKIINLYKNTKNQSYCRNLGIKNANGKYIMFMDADDCYNKNNLLDFIKYIQNKDYDVFFVSSLHKRINGDFYISKFHDDITKELSHSIVQYCVKKEFIIKNNIYFDEKKYYYDSEDAYFFYLLLDKLTYYDVYDQDKPLSIIVQRKWNNTYTKFKNPNYANYLFELCKDLNYLCVNNEKIKYFLRNYYLEELKRINKFNNDEKEHENF